MKKKCWRAKLDTYLIPYQMTQSTLIKGSQTWGCSSENTSKRHICIPYDATWMAICYPCLLCCIIKARSMSASHLNIPKEPIMLVHLLTQWSITGLPSDIGCWDHSNQCCVHGMHTVVAG